MYESLFLPAQARMMSENELEGGGKKIGCSGFDDVCFCPSFVCVYAWGWAG